MANSSVSSASVLLNRLLARGKFRHIQILIRLAELGSVGRAAEAIGVTQSSVTQTLAHLEDLLETPLFHRHARGVQPTDACRDLLPLATQVLLGVTESAEAIAARHRHGDGRVRLLASLAAINGLLMKAMGEFNRQWPGIQIHLQEGERDEQLNAIARAEVDLIVCRRPPVIPGGWEFHPLLADHFVIVCRAQHPLAHLAARGETPSRTALQQAVWLALPAGSAARVHLDEFAASRGGDFRIHPLVTRTPTMMWWLLLQHDLLAILPYTLVSPLLQSGEMKALPMEGQTALEPLGLLQPENELVPSAEVFSAFMRGRCFDSEA